MMSKIKQVVDFENKELDYLVADKNLIQISPLRLRVQSNKEVGDPYTPNNLVFTLIKKYGKEYNGIPIQTLIDKTQFRLVDQCFGMAGITLGTTVLLLKSFVLRHPCTCTNYKVDSTLPGIVYHELIHVSQVLHDGPVKFLMNYIGQWIKSGFSYERMKYRGYEKEAYLAQYELQNLINAYGC